MTKTNSFLLTLIIIIGPLHTFETKTGRGKLAPNIVNLHVPKKPRERHRRLATASEPCCCTTLCNKQTALGVGATVLASYALTQLFIAVHNVNAQEA